jgi:hypothetical protein
MTVLAEAYRSAMRIYGIPESMQGGLLRYLVDRIQPGHFLMAVLSNDLAGAFGRGDTENLAALQAYVMFLVNAVPGAAWGSPDRVTAWLMAPRARGAHS